MQTSDLVVLLLKVKVVLKTDFEFKSISGFHTCTIAEDSYKTKPGTIKLNS